ncbi:hypothetical protein TG4357_02902 [Thalassovita gelatinovora]|uniref:Uncharacterized protein n=1 Tax=Thalassovita gelatinovora TaxID=53501 RepID=A0A0P1FHH2_THAGE|nr:hypothetical protein [Thalassovita gelatinovora]QIZ81902.1 hypothetical protein HFZ77_16145 [Thalassovita gelatinovora]CUH67252.1 hypothetical protein TG4357_02902 [Thalassovita gelatinovora]SEP77621.1 hypothetical protein SAMN04488043_101358 [Thalassovita gelatinovora]
MIEIAQNTRIETAFAAAHAERAKAFGAVFGWLFARPPVPLAANGLTEPCR